MPKKVFKRGLAIIKHKKLLLVVREHNRSKYIIPGGKPEKDETAQQTLEREIKEELSCGIKAASLMYCLITRSKTEITKSKLLS